MTGWLAWGGASLAGVVAVLLTRRAAMRARWHLVRPTLGWSLTRRRMPAPGPIPVAIVGFAVGLCLAGPVAGCALAAYGAAGRVALRRRAAHRCAARTRVDAVDAVAALATELRAGVAVGQALAAAEPAFSGAQAAGGEAALVAHRVRAAIALAEASGAPLADVLDRLDAHLRAVDRARVAASAQAAGAHASAGLLAVMPLAGVGLGLLIGVDPWHVLLATPIGAAALLAAVALQLAGLAWSARLSRVEVSA